MADFNKESQILVTCPKNIAPVLAEEVKGLGFQALNIQPAFVELKGTLTDCMRLNLWLRTAHKVLYKIADFNASNPDQLYQVVKRINWEDFIPANGFFSVSSQVVNDNIRDTRFANLKVKDAIADRIKDKSGIRPDSGSERHGIVIFLHWKQDSASIFIDTSGETIAKHGYRKLPHKAPMQETLAAAVILSSVWKPGQAFINPMCGSGTLGIEAALIACNIAPGVFRDNFGFMHLVDFPMLEWKSMSDAAENGEKELHGRFILSENDPQAIEVSRKNALSAGFRQELEFEICPFEETQIPEHEEGVVILNPEYGERLGEIGQLSETYQAIGDFFKKKCNRYTGYVFTGNVELAKKIGLRPKRKIPFYNGQIEARMLEYEMYIGSRKSKYNL